MNHAWHEQGGLWETGAIYGNMQQSQSAQLADFQKRERQAALALVDKLEADTQAAFEAEQAAATSPAGGRRGNRRPYAHMGTLTPVVVDDVTVAAKRGDQVAYALPQVDVVQGAAPGAPVSRDWLILAGLVAVVGVAWWVAHR